MYQESAIRERFLDYYESHKITQTEIASAIGTKQGSIQRWFSDKSNAMPDLTAIHYLVSNHGLDFDWLMTGIKKDGSDNKALNENTENCQTIKPYDVNLTMAVKELTAQIKGLSETNKEMVEKLMEKLR